MRLRLMIDVMVDDETVAHLGERLADQPIVSLEGLNGVLAGRFVGATPVYATEIEEGVA
jgi:hypothetical protein